MSAAELVKQSRRLPAPTSFVFDTVQELTEDDPVAEALGALAADDLRNATMSALCEAFPAPSEFEDLS